MGRPPHYGMCSRGGDVPSLQKKKKFPFEVAFLVFFSNVNRTFVSASMS